MRKVTFLTIVHNGERFVEETIQSVLNQTETDFWYFIRLNACTDGSEAIVRKYAAMDDRIIVLKNKVNYLTDDGFPYADRRFWPKFDSEYIAKLDHDDILAPDFISTLYPLIKAHHAEQAVGGHIRFDDRTGEKIRSAIPDNFCTERIEDLAPHFPNFFSCLCPQWGKLIDAKLYNKYYNEICNLPSCIHTMPDIWMNFTLLKHCQRIVGVHKPLIYYRVNQISQLYPQYPRRDKMLEAKYMFNYEKDCLKEFGCLTEKNIDRLYHAHRGRMLDAVDAVKGSTMMTPAEKLDYLQFVLQDSFLNTYRDFAMAKIQPRIQAVAASIYESNADDSRLQHFYMYRMEALRSRGIRNNLSAYTEVLLCKDNPMSYGLEAMTPQIWQEMAEQDKCKLIEKVPSLSQNFPASSADSIS